MVIPCDECKGAGFLYFGNDEFETELFKIVQNELEKLCGMKIDNSEFRLIPVSPKKTVTSSMGIKFACSIGIFEISADHIKEFREPRLIGKNGEIDHLIPA